MVFLNVRSDPFFIHRLGMRICGIWPLDDFKSKFGIVYLVPAFLEILPILSPLITLFGKCFEHGPMYELRPMAAAICLSALRLVVRLYGSRSIPLIESTVDDWSSIRDPTEWRIMKRHDKFGTYRMLIATIWYCVYPCVRDGIIVVSSITTTTLDNKKKCAGNNTLMGGNALGFIIVAMKAFDSLSILSWKLLYDSLLRHLCGQFQILKQQFEELLLIKDEKERRQKFRHLVNRHNHLLYLIGKLEDAFNIFLALMIFGVQIMIGVHATELGHAIRNADFIKMAVAFGLITIYTEATFEYYDMSDYLTSCVEMIGDVFTQCNWYELSRESTINFSIVIARSRMPPNLTATKMYKLNRSNFKHFLSTIYSYVSLLVVITND